MKVAITTYSGAQNFGALLQAYALSSYIRELGNECSLINNWPFDTRWFKPRKNLNDILISLVKYREGKKRIDRFNSFRDKYLVLTDGIQSSEDYKKLNEMFDAFVTGSDQVWNCSNGVDQCFYLGMFDDDKIKISYAASFGSATIPEEYTETVKNYLAKIEGLSVREKSGAELIKSITGREALVSVDPVFLKSKEEWARIAHYPMEEEPYIFVYSTQKSERLNKAVAAYVKNHRVKIISTHAIPGCKCTVKKDIGPLEFLGYIQEAQYVISTSFHATAFSMIFQKNFAVIPHSTTGARVIDICEDANLNTCIWNDKDFTSVDYSNAGVIALENRIYKSKQYLAEKLR